MEITLESQPRNLGLSVNNEFVDQESTFKVDHCILMYFQNHERPSFRILVGLCFDILRFFTARSLAVTRGFATLHLILCMPSRRFAWKPDPSGARRHSRKARRLAELPPAAPSW